MFNVETGHEMTNKITDDRRIGGLKPFAQCFEEIHQTPRTGTRWADSDPDFPQVVDVNGKRFIEEYAWDQYKRLLIERGTKNPAQLRARRTPPLSRQPTSRKRA
jgi:hypothetical protein